MSLIHPFEGHPSQWEVLVLEEGIAADVLGHRHTVPHQFEVFSCSQVVNFNKLVDFEEIFLSRNSKTCSYLQEVLWAALSPLP